MHDIYGLLRSMILASLSLSVTRQGCANTAEWIEVLSGENARNEVDAAWRNETTFAYLLRCAMRRCQQSEDERQTSTTKCDVVTKSTQIRVSQSQQSLVTDRQPSCLDISGTDLACNDRLHESYCVFALRRSEVVIQASRL